MKEGLLWFDNDSGSGIEQRVGRAVDHYRDKFGRQPDVCYVHPSVAVKGPKKVGRVRVAPLSSVLRNHFWLGEEKDAS
jgi:hypothetical protein